MIGADSSPHCTQCRFGPNTATAPIDVFNDGGDGARFGPPHVLTRRRAALAAPRIEADSTRASMLFSDIRGFTALTERLGPVETATMLRDYFAILVDCLDRHGGHAETFFGDSMLGIFGVDTPQEDGADLAVQAAIAMRIALASWNRAREAAGKPAVDMGVGINTDDVLYRALGLPNTGAPTPVGAGINLASRLEAACKHYATKILISGSTYQRLKQHYTIRFVDRTMLAGTRRPIDIYEIMDYHTDESFPNLAEALPRFSDGIASYRCQRFKDAIKAFRSALAFNPQDQLSRYYIDRCKRLLQSPPNADWSAIWMPA